MSFVQLSSIFFCCLVAWIRKSGAQELCFLFPKHTNASPCGSLNPLRSQALPLSNSTCPSLQSPVTSGERKHQAFLHIPHPFPLVISTNGKSSRCEARTRSAPSRRSGESLPNAETQKPAWTLFGRAVPLSSKVPAPSKVYNFPSLSCLLGPKPFQSRR